MRHSHPNMYLVFMMLGIVAFANGLGMAITDPRMPAWMPSGPVGAIYAAAGVVAVIAASVRSKINPQTVKLGKLALAVCAVQSMAMAAGLLHHFGTPQAVTQSIDRPIMYIAYAVMCVSTIREPPANPVTATE